MNKNGCEFCGNLKTLAGTQFVGCYCRGCHKMNIEASQEAIREIIEANKVHKPTEQESEG